jgi:hypothetical protein
MLDLTGHVIGLATFITGYNYRFGGAMWIEDAAVLAARAVDPAGARSRVINVPGIEYFMPRDLTSRDYSRLLQKGWRVSDEYAGGGVEEIETTGDYNGARRYATRGMGGPVVLPGTEDELYVDSTGFYKLGRRVDAWWVRTTSDPVPLAVLPLRVGASWDRRDAWQRDTVVAEGFSLGAPALPRSATVDETTTVEGLKDLVTVPAGSYRDCVRITRDQLITTNQGNRERRVVTTWYAAGVGAVKKASEISRPSGIDRATSELGSVRWIR